MIIFKGTTSELLVVALREANWKEELDKNDLKNGIYVWKQKFVYFYPIGADRNR